MSAALLLIEIGGGIKSFETKEKFCSWIGVCPTNNESAGKRKSSRTAKANKYAKSLVCELANSAIKTNSQFKGKYKSLVIRRGHKKSVIAVGHKLMGVVYSVLKNQTYYKDPEIDYEKLTVQKNAPRWLKALEKFGYLK